MKHTICAPRWEWLIPPLTWVEVWFLPTTFLIKKLKTYASFPFSSERQICSYEILRCTTARGKQASYNVAAESPVTGGLISLPEQYTRVEIYRHCPIRRRIRDVFLIIYDILSWKCIDWETKHINRYIFHRRNSASLSPLEPVQLTTESIITK